MGGNGHSTKVYTVITGTTYTPIYTSGTAVSVPKGPAWAGAAAGAHAAAVIWSSRRIRAVVLVPMR
jgi:hypothetical protein